MTFKLGPLAHLVELSIQLAGVILCQTVEDERLQGPRPPNHPDHTRLGRSVGVADEDVADGKGVQVVEFVAGSGAAAAGGGTQLGCRTGGGGGRTGAGGGGLVMVARLGVGAAAAVGAVGIFALSGTVGEMYKLPRYV